MSLLDLLKLNQESLLTLLGSFKAPKHAKIEHRGNLLFVPKNALKYYPLICVHLDTINDYYGTTAPTNDDLEVLDDYIGLSLQSSLACLGGDDRCGVFVALRLLSMGLPYAFGFFKDEETGCIGSSQISFYINEIKEISAFIGLDRKGFNELALYGYNNSELNRLFMKHGYILKTGTITDASKLASLSTNNLACINLSVGYYYEHTSDEFIIPSVSDRLFKVLSSSEIVKNLCAKQFDTNECIYCEDFGYEDYFKEW